MAKKGINLEIKAADQFTLRNLLSDTIAAREYIKVWFRYKSYMADVEGRDSVALKSAFLMLSKNDKLLLNYYLGLHGPSKILLIRISYTGDTVSGIEPSHLHNLKMEKVRKHLIKAAVKKKRIQIAGRKRRSD